MSDNDNLPSFLANEPIPVRVKKNNTWIWVLVGALVLCLCLTVVAVGVGFYLYQNRATNAVSFPPLMATTAPLPPTARPAPTIVPAATEAPLPASTLVIDYYDGSDGGFYPAIIDLVPGWEWIPTIGVVEWDVNVAYSQPVYIFSAWCTSTADALEENFEHIRFTWLADGEPVDMDSLYLVDQTDTDKICRSYIGIVWVWPLGEHAISIDMYFDTPLFDGWSYYAGGHYTNIYTITVTH